MDFHIGIAYTKPIPADTFEDFIDAVSEDGLNFSITSRDRAGPYAGLEWLLPTAVIIFITKSYFESFFKEMGSDHYNLLKEGIVKLIKRLESFNFVLVGTKGKMRQDVRYAHGYSIIHKINDSLRFKLLIEENISEENISESVNYFLEFIKSCYTGNIDSGIIEKISGYPIVSGTILLAFNRDTKTLEPVNPIPEGKINQRTPHQN